MRPITGTGSEAGPVEPFVRERTTRLPVVGPLPHCQRLPSELLSSGETCPRKHVVTGLTTTLTT